jgi:lipocalin
MMRRLALVAALVLPGLAGAEVVRDISRPMVAVAGFDKARLVGEWFEVARSDSVLEVDCHGVTTAIAARDDSRFTLKIACHKGRVGGPVLPIDGVMAEVAPGLYQVRFVRLPQFGNLELAVLWAAEDDSMVVIGSALGQVGWVLTKVATPDEAAMQVGVQVLVDNGYALGAISPVKQ